MRKYGSGYLLFSCSIWRAWFVLELLFELLILFASNLRVANSELVDFYALAGEAAECELQIQSIHVQCLFV